MPTHSKQVLAPIDNVVIPLKKNDYIFSVVAKNKAGSSPPSEINSAEIPTGKYIPKWWVDKPMGGLLFKNGIAS